MQLKVFALLLTIIYVVSCQSHMNTEVQNEAQMEQRSQEMEQRSQEMVQRSQEINKIPEEKINEEPIMTSGRTSDGSQTANERTQVLLAINPKPTTQVIKVQEHKPAHQKPQHVKEVIVAEQVPQKVYATHQKPQHVKEVIVTEQVPQKVYVTHQKPQHVKEVIVAKPTPQKVYVTHQKPQHVKEVIVSEPAPQKVYVTQQKPQQVHQIIVTQPASHQITETDPIPETHSPGCVFLNREGTCATIPSFFSCIRDGGILAPDMVRCSWIQACCIRGFLG